MKISSNCCISAVLLQLWFLSSMGQAPQSPTLKCEKSGAYSVITFNCISDQEVTIKCFFDGEAVENCTLPYSLDVTTLVSGYHIFLVIGKKINTDGIESRATLIFETSAPSLSFDCDEPSRSGEILTFACTPSHEATITCVIDGEAAVPCEMPYNLDTTSFSLGEHVFAVFGETVYGSTTQTIFRFTVAQPPTLDCEQPSTISFRGTTISINCNPDQEVTIECLLDGETVENCVLPYSLDTSTLDVGEHTFTVIGRNADGAEARQTFTFTIAPPPLIFECDDPSTSGSIVTFACTPSREATITCTLDREPVVPCEQPYDLDTSSLSTGEHIFVVSGKTADSVTSQVPFRFTVGVFLSLRRNKIIQNNSVILISDIGQWDLLCYTNNTNCCRRTDSPNGVGMGEWFFPNGSAVRTWSSGDGFYRIRGSTVVRLNRRFGVMSPTGRYRCEIPDASGVTHTLSVNIILKPPITVMVSARGTPAVGQSYSLTCNVTGADRLNITTYQWFKNYNVVSTEIQSTLSFSSLSLSDAGRYRCDVILISNLLNQSFSEISNIQDLILQIPRPISVIVTASLDDSFIVTGLQLNLTCTTELSEAVDIAVTVNTVWSGPSGKQLTNTTSVASMMTDRTYTSTATLSLISKNDSGKYTCTATVSSSNNPFVSDSSESGVRKISVKDTFQMFQLKLRRSDDCATWSDDKALKYQMGIHIEISKAITSRCNCNVPDKNLLDGVFSCHTSNNQTTYRSTIIGTQSHNATELVEFIQDWVNSGPTLTIQWYAVKLDSNCPVSISSLSDPECGQEQVEKKCSYQDLAGRG